MKAEYIVTGGSFLPGAVVGVTREWLTGAETELFGWLFRKKVWRRWAATVLN